MKRIVFVILAMLLGNVYCQEIGYITLFQSAIQDSMVECGKIESNIEFVDSIVNLECDAFDGANTTIYIKKSNTPLFFWGLAKNIYNVADNVKICIQHQPCCGDNIIYYLWVNLERNQNKLDTVVTYYFTDTKIPNPEIWEISRPIKASTNIIARADSEIDEENYYYELRQIGNVVDTIKTNEEYYTLYQIVKGKNKWQFVAFRRNNFMLDLDNRVSEAWHFAWICNVNEDD